MQYIATKKARKRKSLHVALKKVRNPHSEEIDMFENEVKEGERGGPEKEAPQAISYGKVALGCG